MKCKNPNCNNEVPPYRAHRYQAKHCSIACRVVVKRLKEGSLSIDDDSLEREQGGFLTLPNGIEIRNDAMGKEITSFTSKYYTPAR